ncbi:MAG TPA: hypothetical protein VFR58_06745 [Flavisolibacter sp.]|nr:hypothetical protein [Flavisolibacter sp.]
MVQTDVSQLTAECSEWRQILRSYREELQLSKKALQEICRQSPTKDQLKEVEHFDNQFHIQLINIHDLKHNIKLHEKMIEAESPGTEGPAEEVYARHEQLLDQFLMLENTLQELRNDYKNFVSAVSC